MSENSICLFSSYFKDNDIPIHVKYYLLELKRHVEQVYLITNKKKLTKKAHEFLVKHEIGILLVKNKGYDFGMYYQVFEKLNIEESDELVVANDSCYLINSLDPYFIWFRTSSYEMGGLIDSNQFSYHLQSYFLTFQGKGIKLLTEYLENNKTIRNKQKVIETYEIGLTGWMISQGLNVSSFFQSNTLNGIAGQNPAIFRIKELIRLGFPLVKRKLIDGGFTRSDLIYFATQGMVINRNELLELINKSNTGFSMSYLSN